MECCLRSGWEQVVAGDADRVLLTCERVSNDGVVLVCDQEQANNASVLSASEAVVDEGDVEAELTEVLALNLSVLSSMPT